MRILVSASTVKGGVTIVGRQEPYGQHRWGWRANILKEETLYQQCGKERQVWRREAGMERQV